MSFDGPVVQTPNQERRRIQKPPVVIALILLVVVIGVMTWAIAWN